MIKGKLRQQMYKYLSWMEEYKKWLTDDDSRCPSNDQLEIICTVADKVAADCLSVDENDCCAQKLYSSIADVRQLMSER